MNDTGRTVDGWLLTAIFPGLAPDTRQIIETWATSIADRNAAEDAVRKASGSSAAIILMPLDELTLRSMDIAEPGKTARISATF